MACPKTRRHAINSVSMYIANMSIFIKVFKSGNGTRKSRFHTLRGELISFKEISYSPWELLMRLLRIKRKGPWLSKDAINALSEILLQTKNVRVLEIGGGASSVFFSTYSKALLTIEEDPDSLAHRN